MHVRKLAVAAALVVCLDAHAATFCVGTPAELLSALPVAGSNAEPDEIRLEAGTYAAPAGGFLYNAVFSDRAQAIVLSGGWDAACATQAGPYATVLSGGYATAVLRIANLSNFQPWTGAITVANLTIKEGAGSAGALQFAGATHGGDATIRRVAFFNNTGDVDGAMTLASNGRLLIDNSLFAGNLSFVGRGVGSITLGANGVAALVNDTLAQNVSAANLSQLHLSGGRVLFQNDLLVNQGADDVPSVTCAGATVAFRYDSLDLADCTGATFANELPVADAVDDDYRPLESSGLIDAGSPDLGNFLAPWTPVVSTVDLIGLKRVAGVAVDIGALEYDLLSDGFESP